jgi:outer membrane lipoprotein-sorting protein
MPFDQAFRSQMPVSFLTGVGRIADDFVVHIEDGTGEKLRLRLEPKRSSADVGILWLEVDRTTYDIIGAEVKDPLGNTSKLILENLRRNTGLDDRSFRFDIPPGADVMDAARE